MPTADKKSGPLVLHIRMGGRLVPFVAALLLFALLPFLGGSASGPPTTSVVLAAGSPAAVQDAVDAVSQARDELAGLDPSATAAGAPPGSAFSSAIGGGLFLFPAVSLAPVATDAVAAAPLAGVPFFIRPVPGGETSPFGPRIHPLLGRPMFHTGIDLAAACGTPVLAAADGTVIYARISPSWGLRTIIQHTPTVKTAYGHQSQFLVTEGQHVKQGQVIGLSGTTGWSTGCHLHFDVIVDDRYVDPAPYLGFPPSSAASVPYAAVPQLVLDQSTQAIQAVQDGDVPISAASVVTLPPGTAPPLPAALTSPSTSPSATRSGAVPRPPSAPGATTTAPASTRPTTRPSTTTGTTTGTPAAPATTPPSPSSSTPPAPTSTTPPSTTSTPPSPTSTTPPPTTSTPPATQPSSSTTAVATPGATGPSCPSTGPSPTSTTTTGAVPTCPTQTPGPTG